VAAANKQLHTAAIMKVGGWVGGWVGLLSAAAVHCRRFAFARIPNANLNLDRNQHPHQPRPQSQLQPQRTTHKTKAVQQKLITSHTASSERSEAQRFAEELTLESVIGRGGFGVCYKVGWGGGGMGLGGERGWGWGLGGAMGGCDACILVGCGGA